MNEDILQALQTASESITKLTDSNTYMSVGFTTQPAGLNPLKGMLTDILTKLSAKTGKELEAAAKGIKDEIEETNKDYSQTSDEVKKLGALIKGIHNKIKDREDKRNKNTSTLNQYFHNALDNWKENKGSAKRWDKILGFSYQSIILGKDLLKVSQQIFNSLNTAMLTNAEFSADLRAAGVKITEGFDAGFVKYANESGKLREEMVELLKQNSQFISSANGQGLNGVSLLSKETSKLAGKFGLTTKEIDASTKSYNDSMLTTANQSQMVTLNHENELVKTTQALKMFALATGQSYENLVKERQEREKTWQMKKLATDPRTRAQYMMLRDMGLSDELIEGIMLGKHNKATTMAMLDADSARMMNMMRSAYMSTKGNAAEFYRQLGRINHSSAAWNMRNKEANINPEDYAYVQGLGELFAPGTTIWGKMTARTFDLNAEKYLNDKEAEVNNKLVEVNRDLNKSINKLKDALSPSLDTISKFYPGMAKTMTFITGALGSFLSLPGVRHVVGTVAVAGQALAPLANSLLPMFIFGLMSKSKPAIINIAESAAGKFSVTLANESSKATGFLGKLGGVFKSGGGWIIKAANSTIGKTLGALGLIGSGVSTVNDFASGNTGSGWGSIIGGGIGALGFLLGPGVGMLTTALGSQIGSMIGSHWDTPSNEPSSASNTSTYNTSYVDNEQQSSGGTVQPSTVQSTYSSVSVVGMEGLRSLLRDNNAILKNIYSELRTGPMKPGTNMVG